jgi:alanine dehydrogenase
VPGVPVFSAEQVTAALAPRESVDVVRDAFVAHARGTWAMPSKVYLPAPPDGDFRAMPASGGGYAVLKWVTSFPNNPARALPTVSGVVLLSDGETGELRAILHAGAVTALRTGAAAVLAAEALARPTVAPAAVVGCGVNGRAVARTFLAREREVVLWDARPNQAQLVAGELGDGAEVAADLADALACDVVATVTPGRELLFHDGTLHAGQHVSLMGADGPGKAEIAVEELLRARVVVDESEQVVTSGTPVRVRLFCDDWEQAKHGGDLSRGVETGLTRDDVIQLGDVLVGAAPGRESEHDITLFDSTGLAIQDLAVAIAVYERYREDPSTPAFAGTSEIEIG